MRLFRHTILKIVSINVKRNQERQRKKASHKDIRKEERSEVFRAARAGINFDLAMDGTLSEMTILMNKSYLFLTEL